MIEKHAWEKFMNSRREKPMQKINTVRAKLKEILMEGMLIVPAANNASKWFIMRMGEIDQLLGDVCSDCPAQKALQELGAPVTHAKQIEALEICLHSFKNNLDCARCELLGNIYCPWKVK